VTETVTARDVARRAKRILPLMGRIMEAQMRTPVLQLPPIHFHVLNRVDHKPYTLSELAEYTSVSSASLSRTISVMEERGWVTRTRSEEDRRMILIEITAEGKAVLLSIEARSEDFLTDTLDSLSQEELEKLMEGLDLLFGAFAQTMSQLPSDSET
jgi:DNA-binding MarR family transcriptional regulator